MKRDAAIEQGLSFCDVMLVPRESAVKPTAVSTKTRLTKNLTLNIPLIAAGRDNVTESAMAIAIARLGGIGVIHDNMPLGKQVEEVRKVKRAEGNMVLNPITIAANASVAEALDLMTTYKISGIPVTDQTTQKVVGIITSRDVRFFEDYAKPVTELMSKEVVSVQGAVELASAKRMLHEHRIEKLVVTDNQGRAAGLITVKDIEKLERYPMAARDAQGRLRVGAAIGIGKDAYDRAAAMTDAGLDVVFIDVGHAHTRDVAGTVSHIRQQRTNEVQIVVGNVATAEAARMMVDAGADAVKVGLGATSCSASRKYAGVGMPQLTAVINIAEQCAIMGVPVIVGSGIRDSATLAKAIAAGGESAVINCLFRGTDEAPGEIVYHDGAAYKIVNPQAKPHHRPKFSSVSNDAYALDDDKPDTSVPYCGSVSTVVSHLMGGLKTAMAYTGSADIKSMIENASFVRGS